MDRRSFLTLSLAAATLGSCRADLMSRLPSGARYAVIGKRRSRLPVLFAFSGNADSSLNHVPLSSVPVALSENGFLAVSLDLPCHGEDILPGEPVKLAGWRYRVDRGADLMADFTKRCRECLDVLIASGDADPQRVLAFGISRGGWSALHVAAADNRVRAVAAIAPVTDLAQLVEFKGCAAKLPIAPLAACPAWIAIRENDPRVGTQAALAYAARTKADVRMVAGEGHGVDEATYAAAVGWLKDRAAV